MPRPPRQLADDGYYHLIGRANNRLFIFNGVDEFRMFKELITRAKQKFAWKLHHYCLMSDHIHLLAHFDRGLDLPEMMQFLLHGYSRWYHDKYEYVGHLWQGRYKSPLIERESYMLECARYIERNPVRANIVSRPEEYPWSSYRFYALGEQDPLVDEDPYFESFGADLIRRRKLYQEFVRIEGHYKEPVRRPLVHASLVPAS